MGFSTADICDEHNDKVFVLDSEYRNYGGAAKCKGQIVTLKLERNNSDLISLLRDEDGTGKIAVVDVEKAYFAVVGENLMSFAARSNYAGILVNGYIRDAFQIKEIPVALYALGTCPRKYIPTTQGEKNIQLSFGGVDFNDGNYLYADIDGVIVTAKKVV